MTLTPQQALQVLDQATQPQSAGRLTREDYVNVQLALECLQSLVVQGAESELAKQGNPEQDKRACPTAPPSPSSPSPES